MVAAVLVIATAQIARQPLFDHYMNKHIPPKQRATVLSAISMLQRLVIGILYPIAGLLSDISIYYAIVMLGGLIIIFSFVGRVDAHHLT